MARRPPCLPRPTICNTRHLRRSKTTNRAGGESRLGRYSILFEKRRSRRKAGPASRRVRNPAQADCGESWPTRLAAPRPRGPTCEAPLSRQSASSAPSPRLCDRREHGDELTVQGPDGACCTLVPAAARAAPRAREQPAGRQSQPRRSRRAWPWPPRRARRRRRRAERPAGTRARPEAAGAGARARGARPCLGACWVPRLLSATPCEGTIPRGSEGKNSPAAEAGKPAPEGVLCPRGSGGKNSPAAEAGKPAPRGRAVPAGERG